MTHLQFNSTNDLKFSHSLEGVIADYKKIKHILGYLSISQKNVDFTDQQYLDFANTILVSQCLLRNKPLHLVENVNPISSNNFINDFSPFYKYTSNDVFNKYIKNGIWQLGTINQYRTIENIKQRDEFEGYSFINLNINNQIVSAVFNTCFNYYVFCATKTDESVEHRNQFGEKKLSFTNVRSFAEAMCKTINARRYFIQNVEYNTLKLYINKEPIYNPKIDVNQVLTPEYFELIKKHVFYPSLFVKPDAFKHENEVRIVFEMYKDCKQPLRFQNKNLLKYCSY
jgi:hypothetical protein